MIRKVEMERYTVTSSKPFDAVVAAIKASIGHPNMAELWQAAQRAKTAAEWVWDPGSRGFPGFIRRGGETWVPGRLVGLGRPGLSARPVAPGCCRSLRPKRKRPVLRAQARTFR